MIGMAIKSELRKLTTTRLWWGMAIGIVFLGSGFAALVAWFGGNGARNSGETPLEHASSVYTSGIGLGYPLLLVIGTLAIGTEYRHKTITSTLLATPSRVRMIAAKIVALLICGSAYGVLFLAASVGAGATILAAKNSPVFPEPAVLIRTLALCLLVLGLWALVGLGLGVLIPNQVAALLIGVGLAFIVEPIAATILANISWGEVASKYFPSRATAAITLQDRGARGPASAYLLTWWQGSLVMMAYAALFAALGTFFTQRRDIS